MPGTSELRALGVGRRKARTGTGRAARPGRPPRRVRNCSSPRLVRGRALRGRGAVSAMHVVNLPYSKAVCDQELLLFPVTASRRRGEIPLPRAYRPDLLFRAHEKRPVVFSSARRHSRGRALPPLGGPRERSIRACPPTRPAVLVWYSIVRACSCSTRARRSFGVSVAGRQGPARGVRPDQAAPLDACAIVHPPA